MIKNRTMFTGDNLPILRGMADACVDLIYLDPPFNSNRTYEAPSGSKAAGAQFKDAWTMADTEEVWWSEMRARNRRLYDAIGVAALAGKGGAAYLMYMAVRLMEMRRVLKPTGSIYLHCDPTMSHYLKMAMDAVFGYENFRNEIVWNKGYRGTPRQKRYQQEHDTLLFYSKTKTYTWVQMFGAYKDETLSRYNKDDGDGKKYALIKRKKADGTIYYGKSYPAGKRIGDVIDIPTLSATTKERTGYPTQKPLALLTSIIKASSHKGDVVLDPFCGCATACIAAEQEGRHWIGIDISEKSFPLVKARLQGICDIHHRTDIPKDRRGKFFVPLARG